MVLGFVHAAWLCTCSYFHSTGANARPVLPAMAAIHIGSFQKRTAAASGSASESATKRQKLYGSDVHPAEELLEKLTGVRRLCLSGQECADYGHPPPCMFKAFHVCSRRYFARDADVDFFRVADSGREAADRAADNRMAQPATDDASELIQTILTDRDAFIGELATLRLMRALDATPEQVAEQDFTVHGYLSHFNVLLQTAGVRILGSRATSLIAECRVQADDDRFLEEMERAKSIVESPAWTARLTGLEAPGIAADSCMAQPATDGASELIQMILTDRDAFIGELATLRQMRTLDATPKQVAEQDFVVHEHLSQFNFLLQAAGVRTLGSEANSLIAECRVRVDDDRFLEEMERVKSIVESPVWIAQLKRM